MPTSDAELDALRRARLSPVKSTTSGEDSVVYKSDAEMAAAIAAGEREAARSRTAARPHNGRQMRGFQVSRGY
jgi:hypothetical protein